MEREHGKRISREKESMKEQNVWQEVKDILRQKQFGKLFSGDTENTLIQFFRYCFVDGAATVVDWGRFLPTILFCICTGTRCCGKCNFICVGIDCQLSAQHPMDF